MSSRPDDDGRFGPYCGGTLIASKYVISAAHCFFKVDKNTKLVTSAKTAEETAIIIGSHNIGSIGLDNFVNVKTLTHHPKYNGQIIGQKGDISDGFDITILELEEEVDLEVYTPACLAETSDSTAFDGKMATAAGWGLLADKGDRTDVPHEVDVPVIAECGYQYTAIPSIICTLLPEGGKSPCQVSETN